MTVLGVSVLFTFYSFMFGVGRANGTSINEMPLMLVGYGFGASFVALFRAARRRNLHQGGGRWGGSGG